MSRPRYLGPTERQIMMWYWFPGMWRALTGGISLLRRKRPPKIDVYVLRLSVRDGGKLLFLFPKPIPAHGQGSMVNALSAMPFVVGGSIDVFARSVTVEWAPFPGVWQEPDYLIGDIRLTVFEHLLGDWQPAMVDLKKVRVDDLPGTLRTLGALHQVDWVSELGLQLS